MTNNKSFTSKFFYLLLILLFTFEVINFGPNSVEQYSLGLYSTKFFWNSSNLFSSFNDFIGPGAKMPLGSGPFLHPLNFFIKEVKLYFFLFILCHLIIQIEFTKKILELLKIKYNLLLLTILLTFSLPNILYASVEDWIAPFFSYTFFPVILYYAINIIKYQKKIDYLKFSFAFPFWILNGHSGHIATYIIFLFFFMIFSLENLKNFKKIFKPIFFAGFFLILLILSELLYYLVREFQNFDGWRASHGSYSLINFLEIFYPNENNITSLGTNFSLFRMPGNPILIYICLYISVLSILNFITKSRYNKNFQLFVSSFFVKINNDISLKLSCLFIIFLTFSLIPILLFIPVVSAAYMARDVFLYIGIFLFFSFKNKFKKNLRLFLNILLIFYTSLYFVINIKNKIEIDTNNFVLDRVNNSDLKETFVNLNLKENDYSRIYLSPDLFPEIRNDFREEGFFSWTDFNKFNISPFNAYFKYTSMRGFGDERNLMRGTINSHYKLINDNFFLNIFKIDFILISQNEVKLINNKKLKLIKTINTRQEKLYLYRNIPVNYSINEKNISKLNLNFKNCKERKLISGRWVNDDSKLDCLLRSKKLFKISDHKLDRKYNAAFSISNFNSNEYLVLPFIYDKNWKVNKGSILNAGNFLPILDTKKIKDEVVSLEYFDNIRFYLRLISFMSASFLLIIILVDKFKSRR